MSSLGKVKKIGLVYAMSLEAKPLLETLKFRQVLLPHEKSPVLRYEASWKGLELFLACAGEDPRYRVANVGTAGAVLATQTLTQQCDLELILNPGTAGGFQSRGAVIGDVYFGKRDVRFFDRRTPVRRYQEAFLGKYPVIEASQLAKRVGVKLGHVCTGSSFDCSPTDLNCLVAQDADLKEMEAAAIGWVSWIQGIPFLPIKAVTDLVESHETAEAQFVQNYRLACRQLTQAVIATLEALAGE